MEQKLDLHTMLNSLSIGSVVRNNGAASCFIKQSYSTNIEKLIDELGYASLEELKGTSPVSLEDILTEAHIGKWVDFMDTVTTEKMLDSYLFAGPIEVMSGYDWVPIGSRR